MIGAEGRILARVVRTCHGCPSQWDAWTVGGRYLYLRHRHGEGGVERTPDSWNEGRPELLVEWDDGTATGVIGPAEFLLAAGLEPAPGASIA
ncbi:hypothetical protein ACIP98_03000 [Streptomyces sp. NPDC088354]|uniref:hypothetical protein n=1 Tax=Streptomyces sp. NPDC088354 TaxID=3365856 RepID=UPI00382D104E